MVCSPQTLAESRAEYLNLSALFSITPKEGRKALIRKMQDLTLPPPQEVVETPPQSASPPVFPTLHETSNIFNGLGWGENRRAFVQLEHLVNDMRKTASVYHLLLVGPPSVGKTITAGRVARALERPYYEGSASFLADFPSPVAGLVAHISRLWKGIPVMGTYIHDDGFSPVEILAPTIIFIDEAQELSKSIQNALLPLMVSPFRAAHGERYVDFRNVMFILGTTDPADLLRPLRTRCRPIDFIGYGVDSVAQMVRMSYPQVTVDEAKHIARGGKLYPRRALSVARTCVELADKYGGVSRVLTDHLGIDADGCDSTDQRILTSLDAAVVTPDPRKVDAARNLLKLVEDGFSANANQLAAAKTLLDNPKVHRPVGRQALAERIMSTDSMDIMERVSYLELIGKVFQSSRGVQLAV